jgi:hypothetical protein
MKLIINEELETILKKLADENNIAQDILKHNFEEDSNYINYLGVSETTKGYISYLTKGKINSGFIKDFWEARVRLHKNPAGIVELLFPNTHTQRAKEVFTERYRNVIQQLEIKDDLITIVEGDKIREYYSEDSYIDTDDEDGGIIHSSCMRYESCQDYFDLYTKNTKNVGMAVILDIYKKVRARCILWYPEGKEEGKPVWYDRIYGASTAVEKEMQAALEKRGFINISCKNTIKPDEEPERTIILEYGRSDIKYFPYMDTMCYLSGKKIGNESLSGGCKMRDTDGGITDDRDSCARCGDYADDDDLHEIVIGDYRHNYLCENCCTHSEYHDGYISTNNSVYVSNEDTDVLSSLTVMDYEAEYILRENAERLWDGEYADREVETILTSADGKKFLLDDDNFIEIQGHGYYQVDSEDIEEIDGEYYLIGSSEYEKAILLMEEEI